MLYALFSWSGLDLNFISLTYEIHMLLVRPCFSFVINYNKVYCLFDLKNVINECLRASSQKLVTLSQIVELLTATGDVIVYD